MDRLKRGMGAVSAFSEDTKTRLQSAVEDTNSRLQSAVDVASDAVNSARDISVKALGDAPLIGETVKSLNLASEGGGGGGGLPANATQEEIIAHRHEQLQLKFDGPDGPWHPGPDATMEDLTDYRTFLLLEQGMDSPTVTNHSLQKYVVVNPAIVRAGFELTSDKVSGPLRVGEIIDAIETAYNEDGPRPRSQPLPLAAAFHQLASDKCLPNIGTLRIRCTRGWASAFALDGTVLLQAMISEEEAIAQAARESTLADAQHRAEDAAAASSIEFEKAQGHIDACSFREAAAAYQRAADADAREAERAFECILDAARAAIEAGNFSVRADPAHLFSMTAHSFPAVLFVGNP